MIKELKEPKEEVMMDCFQDNVKTNDLKDTPPQRKNKKVSKNRRKTEGKKRPSSIFWKNTRTQEFF